MLETSARLLRLLSLLQSRRVWSGAELAEELSVTERTVRRDVEKLRSLGYPVEATSGVAGGYRLGAGAKLPPLLLDDDEALAVTLGLRSAAAGAVAGMEEAALRALDKLGYMLPDRLRRRLASWRHSVVTSPFVGAQVDPDWLVALVQASDARTNVRFAYRDRTGRESERRAEPHGLVHRYARWYLVAWDLDRADWRTFRVDRLATRPEVGSGFAPRAIPGGDLATYVEQSLAAQPYAFEATVEFAAPVHEISERLPPGSAQLAPHGPGRCLAEIGANDPDRLALYLASVGIGFVVHDPPELVAALRELAARIDRAVGA